MRSPRVIRVVIAKGPDDEELNKLFQAYVKELGAFVYSWNHLQERLAHLFWLAIGVKNGAVPFAIWHSVTNDSAQRKMLRAAVEAAYRDNEQALTEIKWL